MLLKTSRYDTETSDGAFKATLKGAIPGAALGGGLGTYALTKSSPKMLEDAIVAELEHEPNTVKGWLKRLWARKPMAYPVIGALAGAGLGGLAAHTIHDRFKKARRDAVDKRKQLKMKKTGASRGNRAETELEARTDGRTKGFIAGTVAGYPLAKYVYRPDDEAAKRIGEILENERRIARHMFSKTPDPTYHTTKSLDEAIAHNKRFGRANAWGKAGLMLSLGTLGGYLGDYLALRNYKQRDK